jgi:hypothetical protein
MQFAPNNALFQRIERAHQPAAAGFPPRCIKQQGIRSLNGSNT